MSATTRGEDLKGKTESAVAKLPASVGLAEIFSIALGVSSSSVDTFSDSLDSEESIHPKCPCKVPIGMMCQFQLNLF